MDRYSGCLKFKGGSKSVQVLLNGIEAVLARTSFILKQRALYVIPNILVPYSRLQIVGIWAGDDL